MLYDPDPAATTTAATKVMLLLSDGIHNRPKGGACNDGSSPYRDEDSCWPGANAKAAYDNAIAAAKAKNVLFYSMPLQQTGERGATAVRNGEIQGAVFESWRNFGEDTGPLFSEVYKALRGQQLARSHLTQPVIRGNSR